MLDLRELLTTATELGASDVHLHVGDSARVRVGGRLVPVDPEAEPLRREQTLDALHEMLPSDRIADFERDHEIDFAYSLPGTARFRVNAFVQRGSITMILRALPPSPPTIAELGLPETVRTLADAERGIVLVTGTTGSGKSTTLAAMVDHINRNYDKHVVTIEDPIEYLHWDARCLIDQREVGPDTQSFHTALRRVLRQDPDVILIGEMRDEETVRVAVSAAETGHLVLSTLHTLDAPETVNRVLDFFPPARQNQVRAMLSGTLRGIVSQRLVPGAGPGGRVAICEVLTMTGRVHDMILDPQLTEQLPSAIAEGDFYGMQTFDQALYHALQQERITYETAMRAASHPHDLKLLIGAEGAMGTHMGHLDAVDADPVTAR